MARNLPLLVAFACLTLLIAAQGVTAAPHGAKRAQPLGSGLLAPPGTCAGEADLDAPLATQRRAMSCLADFARRAIGLSALADSPELDRSAGAKSADVLHCDAFSHFACGREFTFWMRRFGFVSSSCWQAAENLAWGTGRRGSARSAFRAQIHSPQHRRNILGSYTLLGVGLREGKLGSRRNVRMWTVHLGSRCKAAPHRRRA
jgi:hypothetical protein